ncbi:MAG: beta-lactamase family protein [Chitinophagaceae bacterium]|nr:beta-lactamase family protein [Chitinophagaceae bacterium]MBK8300651.1 beta-lactamase family protein [Chitinophagaceae bacterium]
MSYKVSSICLKVLSVASFLLLLQPAKAQYEWSKLDAELQAKQKLLGDNVVAMIWKGDSLVYKKEMGGFNSKTQAPIASCSKWLTAALVMQFVDEGKLSLDDKVVKYLPEFEKYFKNYITIRHCLSHMTGIQDDDKFLRRILERRKLSSLEEEVNAFAARDIRANPGTDFWYGNVGLNIAGRVLEVISKKKFDVLIKSKLFIPLGMTKTTFAELNGGPVNPSGGAKSTADDYMKFLVMLLNNGKHNGVQILTENSVNEMRKVQNKTVQIMYAPKSAEGYLYASGSWVIAYKDSTIDAGTKKSMTAVPPLPESRTREISVATSLASPGLFGTWPMIDYCRGYVYIVFVKNLLGEERADAHRQLKKIVDEQFPTACH